MFSSLKIGCTSGRRVSQRRHVPSERMAQGAAAWLARVAVVTMLGALGGCSTVEPMSFDFKWFEDEPAYSWLVACTGEPPQVGSSYAGRIEIADPKLARRLARMESWDKLEAEDLKGMRCTSAQDG